MSRLQTLCLAALLGLGLVGSATQARAQDAARKPAAARTAPTAPAAGKMESVTGPVKGAVSGKSFTIARKGGPVTVDASGAKVRENGKFAKLDGLKGGTMVTARGTMNGSTLKATEITIHAKGPGKAAATGKKPKMTPVATGAGTAPAPKR
ncbi:MAG TPA: hypothetical protein VFU47_15560 [Armatimonadota bacterium]|nr:hypothetical protein [Armatimonadota bacterium]